MSHLGDAGAERQPGFGEWTARVQALSWDLEQATASLAGGSPPMDLAVLVCQCVVGLEQCQKDMPPHLHAALLMARANTAAKGALRMLRARARDVPDDLRLPRHRSIGGSA